MVEVTDHADEERYVVTVDGAEAGFLAYRRRGNGFVALHTEIDPAYEGQGLGSTLVRSVLDEVRRSGQRLRPICPFVTRYLASHPEYQGLVDEADSPHGEGESWSTGRNAE